MHSLKRMPIVMAAIAVLAISLLAFAAPSASASVEKGFHLDKTCSEAPSEPLGYMCTVTHSDFAWIPAGTDVHYLSQDGNVVQAMIRIRNGSASGACTWSSDVNAVCVFSHGTGRLTQFHLRVDVTANADQSVWFWDGTYWFGG